MQILQIVQISITRKRIRKIHIREKVSYINNPLILK